MKLRHALIFSLLFCSCGGLNRSDLETLLSDNKTELVYAANQLLKHKEINHLVIATDYDSTRCQSINKWFNCPTSDKRWEIWDDSLQAKVYLSSRLEVLRHENIDTNTFNFFHKFLRRQELTQISRCYFPSENCVEFESLLNGLRFYTSSPNELKQDDEYLYVKRIDNNWFVYTRDWN